MSEIRLHEEIEIDRPSHEVWQIVADYTRDPEWREGVVTMAPSTRGPVVVGTTTSEELHLARRTWSNLGEVVEVDPGSHFAWRTVQGAEAYGSRTVTALSPDRTRVDLRVCVTPRSAAERLLRPMFVRLLGRGLRGDAQRLRMLAETQATAARPVRKY